MMMDEHRPAMNSSYIEIKGSPKRSLVKQVSPVSEDKWSGHARNLVKWRTNIYSYVLTTNKHPPK